MDIAPTINGLKSKDEKNSDGKLSDIDDCSDSENTS